MPEPVICIWLALANDAKCKLARRNPAAVEDEIDAWAQGEKLFAIRQRNGEAELTVDEETERVYRQIMEDITASTSVIAERDTAEKKSAPALENQPTTLPRSLSEVEARLSENHLSSTGCLTRKDFNT